MKALILAGGRGTRLGAATDGVNKCMLKAQGRPLIEYSLICASRLALIREIVIVVGYRAEDIIRHFGSSYGAYRQRTPRHPEAKPKDLRDSSPPSAAQNDGMLHDGMMFPVRKPVIYVRQREQRGLVHAIECARDTIGDADVMLMLGDELMINPRHEEFLEEFRRKDIFALCGVVRVRDRGLISRTYAVIQSENGRISRLIEKPHRPPNDIMGTGNCVFRNAIFDYISRTPVNQNRQEKELPDLIQCAVDDGHNVGVFPICDEYINVNSRRELAESASYFAHV